MNTLAKTKGLRRTHATFGKCERLAYVLSTNYFRRTEKIFSPPKKPKNAGCFGKNAGMRETTKFAGFPARLRDG